MRTAEQRLKDVEKQRSEEVASLELQNVKSALKLAHQHDELRRKSKMQTP